MESPFSENEGLRSVQLEGIFRTHFIGIYRYIYRQVKHAIIAEDLTSIVFLRALRWLQQDRSQESIKGWLYATARSIIADYWRDQAQMHLLPLEAAQDLPMLSDESNEQTRSKQALLYRLLDRLTDRERNILTLRYFQGYSAAEIGQALGISANHVRVLQLRALRRAASLEIKERNIFMESPIMPYNEQALRVLELTKEEAGALGHQYLSTEHLLLGILREGSAATELFEQGITFENIRDDIVFISEQCPEEASDLPLDFNPRTKQVFAIASEEAQREGATAVSPHHLLVALVREGEGMAAVILDIAGVSLEQVGETVQIKVVPDRPITLPDDLFMSLLEHPTAYDEFIWLPFDEQEQFIECIEQIVEESARSQQIEKFIKQLLQIYHANPKY